MGRLTGKRICSETTGLAVQAKARLNSIGMQLGAHGLGDMQMGKVSVYSGSSKSTTSAGSDLQSKLARVPEWAMDLDSERVKVACWFEGAEMRLRPKWDGVVEVICETACKADWLINNYRDGIWRKAKDIHGGSMKGLLIRPAQVGDAAGLRAWCFKSGLGSSQSLVAASAVYQAMNDAADAIVMGRWKATAAEQPEL